MIRSLALVIALVLCGQSLDSQTSTPKHLFITILDGEGALNDVRQRTAREPIVYVEDENHKPVAGAAVIFSLPEVGPSGTFSGSSTLLNAVTDAGGHAVGRGLVPNKVTGKYQIQITAHYQDLTAYATLSQTNVVGSIVSATHTAAHGLSLKAVLIVVAVAATATVVTVATHGGSSNAGAVLSPGTSTVGPPPAAVIRHQ